MKYIKITVVFVFLIILNFVVKIDLSAGDNTGDKKKSKIKTEKSCCENKKVEGKCTGKSNCTACSNCSRCGWCNSGGSCGVCRPSYTPKYEAKPSTGGSKGTSGTSGSGSGSGSSGSTTVKPIFPSTTATVYKVTTAELNLREGPSTSDKKLMTLHKGDWVAKVEDYDTNWMKVEVYLSDGTTVTGYVNKAYIIQD